MPDDLPAWVMERAHRIADDSIDNRICCNEYPRHQTEAWRSHLSTEIARALVAVRRDAIEEVAQAVDTITLHSSDFSRAEMDMFSRGIRYAVRTIRALADKNQ